MPNLYCTADTIGIETGGGIVTRNELEALRKDDHLCPLCGKTFPSPSKLQRHLKAESRGFKRNDWTKEELEALRQLYTSHKKNEIMAAVSRHPWQSIQSKAKRLGIHRPNTWMVKAFESRKVDEVMKIWAAGFFDGEGTLNITKAKNGGYCNYLPRAFVGCSFKPAIEFFQSCWGGSIHVRYHEARKPMFLWQSGTEANIYQLVIDLLPYVKVKSAHFSLMKDFIEEIRSFRAIRHACSGSFGKQSENEQRYREGIYSKMKELNRVGI